MDERSLLTQSRAPKNTPELFSYIVRYDDGAAPNPYWGTCTLVICKPAIRRKANVGDWIVGLGSKANPTRVNYSGKIVYVMKVTRKMTMEAYNRYTNERLHNKIPVTPAPGVKLRRDSKEWRLRLGDSIYDFSQKGKPQRPGVHKRKNRITDMSGENALLSSEFVYFGDRAIPLPKSLRGILHRNQGHRSRLNADHLPAFLNWWKTNRKKFARNRVRGVPQWDVFASRKNLGACAEAHMKEDKEDNRFGCT
jgi:hypothetical protein